MEEGDAGTLLVEIKTSESFLEGRLEVCLLVLAMIFFFLLNLQPPCTCIHVLFAVYFPFTYFNVYGHIILKLIK